MKRIQTDILDAVTFKASYSHQNTVVCWEGDVFWVIYHGNTIAKGHRIKEPPCYKVDMATFAGWHTTSTALRLKALGVDTRALWRKENPDKETK